uniref:Uncharacterized protein n=1 Tax=Solibacter usitatus (strain Ellin6076) TaxID=234267 RepID=Q028F5_SOLUE
MSIPRDRSLSGALGRPDWRPGGEFTASELRLEQRYFLQRLRRHLRLAHGWGVVCGLNVVSAGGWCLTICPGYGIGPCGDEILVESPFRFCIRDYLWTQPVGNQLNRVWIALEAVGQPAAYEPAPQPHCSCGCAGDREEISRLSDGFKVVVLWTPPVLRRVEFDICSDATPPCPQCPEICALTLASVALPASDRAILNVAITNVR